MCAARADGFGVGGWRVCCWASVPLPLPPLPPSTLQIPTFRADPLQPACDTWCEFPVADRANAVAQWLAAVLKDPSMLKGAWVLMLETDYVWRMPVQVSGSGEEGEGAARGGKANGAVAGGSSKRPWLG